MRFVRRFPGDPQSVPAARRFATELLGDSPEDLRQSVELMVSELATNGVRHGETSFELAVERTGGTVRVAVTDHGGGTPAMRFPSPDEPSGRGLQIVDMLSEDWGVIEEPRSGKTVWFTVSAPEESPERPGSVGGWRRAPREPTAWTFLVARSEPALVVARSEPALVAV